MNLYLIFGAVIAVCVAAGGAYSRGCEAGKAEILARQASEAAKAQAQVLTELRALGSNVAMLKPVNRTIKQKVGREVIEKPVIRAGIGSVRQFNADPACDSAGKSNCPTPTKLGDDSFGALGTEGPGNA